MNVTYKIGRAHKWASSAVFLFAVLAFAAGPPAAGQGPVEEDIGFRFGFFKEEIKTVLMRDTLCNSFTREKSISGVPLQIADQVIVPCAEFTAEFIRKLISEEPVALPSTPRAALAGVANLTEIVASVSFKTKPLRFAARWAYSGTSTGGGFTSPNSPRSASELAAEQRSDVWVGTGESNFLFVNGTWELGSFDLLSGANIGGSDAEQPVDVSFFGLNDFSNT